MGEITARNGRIKTFDGVTVELTKAWREERAGQVV